MANLNPVSAEIEFLKNSFKEGIKHFKEEQYEQALEYFDKTLKNNVTYSKISDRKIIFYLFRCYHKLKNYKKASTLLLKLTGMFHDKSFNNFELGLMQLNKFLKSYEVDKLELAQKYFNKSVRSDPKDPDNWYYLGYCKALKVVENDNQFRLESQHFSTAWVPDGFCLDKTSLTC